jgi:hypothetical protein
MVTRVGTVGNNRKRQQTENGPSGLQPAEADASNFGAFMMQNNGTATLTRSEASQVSPVIDRSTWADDYENPNYTLTVRIEFPLSPSLMVAALYYDRAYATALDLRDDSDVWQQAALVLLDLGLEGLACQEGMLDEAIRRGMVEDPAWLALVRQRVAEVTGAAR